MQRKGISGAPIGTGSCPLSSRTRSWGRTSVSLPMMWSPNKGGRGRNTPASLSFSPSISYPCFPFDDPDQKAGIKGCWGLSTGVELSLGDTELGREGWGGGGESKRRPVSQGVRAKGAGDLCKAPGLRQAPDKCIQFRHRSRWCLLVLKGVLSSQEAK